MCYRTPKDPARDDWLIVAGIVVILVMLAVQVIGRAVVRPEAPEAPAAGEVREAGR